MSYYVYMLFSKPDGTLYIGVTNDLVRRVYEHKEKKIPGFTEKYKVNKLGYYEIYGQIEDAIKREKQLKCWRREKKINLMMLQNPNWRDLSMDILK